MTSHGKEGIELSEGEKGFIQPHFNMIVVGKPGSGKTSLVEEMYHNHFENKFEHVLLVSPSAQKLDIDLKPQFVKKTLDVDWIFDHIDKVNDVQIAK